MAAPVPVDRPNQARAAPRFSVGLIFTLALGLFRRHFLIFLLLGLGFAVGNLAIEYTVGRDFGGESLLNFSRWIFDWQDFLRRAAISFLLGIAWFSFFNACVAHLVVRDLRGKPVSFPLVLAEGLRTTGHVFTLLSIFYLASLAFALVAAIGLGVTFFMPDSVNPVGLYLGLLFFGVMLIPIFFHLMAAVWPIMTVTALERAWPIASIKRSLALTKGVRWAILGLILVLIVIFWMISIPAVIFQMILPSVITGMAISLWQSLLLTFGLAVPAVGYHVLSLEKDGLSTETLSKIFE